MRRIKEVIIIRTVDSDGSTFRAIMDALRDKRVEIIELAAPSHNVLAFGNIEIYPERRIVLKAGEKVRLNHGEFSMLLLLASTPGQVFSKEQLYDAAWNEEYRYGTTAVENIIWRLRQKLEDDPKHPVYIKTVIRSGYKIELPR
ncbi:winged helix-turn-helix domain-containing protein [Flavonifractor sp. An4]|uniref:winged helix-turn-helix domain-containing protein n=1 Tax=Flavonifractor sp. An4 TaxID=1965634 RepID=UPI001FA8244A|nr:response regulator transcription factor [Flavonifractor sp. An4]